MMPAQLAHHESTIGVIDKDAAVIFTVAVEILPCAVKGQSRPSVVSAVVSGVDFNAFALTSAGKVVHVFVSGNK